MPQQADKQLNTKTKTLQCKVEANIEVIQYLKINLNILELVYFGDIIGHI